MTWRIRSIIRRTSSSSSRGHTRPSRNLQNPATSYLHNQQNKRLTYRQALTHATVRKRAYDGAWLQIELTHVERRVFCRKCYHGFCDRHDLTCDGYMAKLRLHCNINSLKGKLTFASPTAVRTHLPYASRSTYIFSLLVQSAVTETRAHKQRVVEDCWSAAS